MNLDRNTNPDGTGKYALVLMREVPTVGDGSEKAVEIRRALQTLEHHGCLDYGNVGDREFFVIRLRDKYAEDALHAYADAASFDDKQWSDEVYSLARKAHAHPGKKQPD